MRIFCKCRGVGFDDEARRLIAASCRKDGRETMQGMGILELARMEHALDNQLRQRKTAEQMKQEFHRRERLRQKKRVDDDKSPYASERARHWLQHEAELFWGDGWEIRLSGLMAKMIRDTGIVPENAMTTEMTASGAGEDGGRLPPRTTITTVHWNDGKIPRALHQKVCRAVEAMSGREMRNPKSET